MNLVTTTTTGAQSLTLSKKSWEVLSIISNYGTYSGLTFTFQASLDGTNFANVGVVDKSSGLFIQGGTAISPSNNSVNNWELLGVYSVVQMKISALSVATSLTFTKESLGQGADTQILATTPVGVTALPLVAYSTGTTTTTFTAAEATGGQLTVYNSTATTPGSIATPTAAAMYAAQPSAAIGQQWIWRIINSSGSANTMTITADASVTLSGTTTYTIAEFAYRDFLMTFTTATTATMKAICGGSAATN